MLGNKKVEFDVNEVKQQLDDANKNKEENIRQLKRISVSYREKSRECEEIVMKLF